MAYVTPKTNWNDSNAPIGTDFNRIEGNIKANHEAILTESSQREIADEALQSNINAINNRVGNANGQIPMSNGSTCYNLRAQYADNATNSTSSYNADNAYKFDNLNYGQSKRFFNGVQHSSSLSEYLKIDFSESGDYRVNGGCFIDGTAYIMTRINVHKILGVGTFYSLYAMNITTGIITNLLSLPGDTVINSYFSW